MSKEEASNEQFLWDDKAYEKSNHWGLVYSSGGVMKLDFKPKPISTKLKKLKKKLGLNNKDLAERIGCSSSMMTRYIKYKEAASRTMHILVDLLLEIEGD